MEVVQQIINKISEVASILIIGNGNNGDSLAASLALRSFLRKLEKEAVVLSPMGIADRYNFLPNAEQVVDRVDLKKNFVVDVDTSRTALAELSYKKEVDRLSIFLKPGSGEFSAQDVSFRSSNFPFDLIVTVGISSPEQLGDFYSNNTSLFFETSIINIDYRGSNESFGQFNLINLAATSACEIVFDLINKFEASLIDENIATQLLAGIIVETNSFQHVRTTPQTFLKASQLVSLGAKQQEIISHLYKTKSLGLLKLWGRVLARLKEDNSLNLVYSAINQNDLTRSSASHEDVESILKEMATQLTFAKIFVFLKEETDDRTTVYSHTVLPINLSDIFGQFNPQNVNNGVKFTIPQQLPDAEKEVLEILRVKVEKLKPNL